MSYPIHKLLIHDTVSMVQQKAIIFSSIGAKKKIAIFAVPHCFVLYICRSTDIFFLSLHLVHESGPGKTASLEQI